MNLGIYKKPQMRIRVIKTGLLATVQDMGRIKGLPMAVPVSGVMDAYSARIANYAVGNAGEDAVIEFTYGGAALEAETNILIAYAGGGACMEIDKQTLPPGKPLFIPAGTIINLVNNPGGCRTYLAIAGGWDVPDVIDSKSTCLVAGFGGFNGRALQPQDVLSASSARSALSQKILAELDGTAVNCPKWQIPGRGASSSEHIIRVMRGHESGWFDGQSVSRFFAGPYTLSLKSNRMGYHLEGPAMSRSNEQELLSTAVTPGTIQVTGNGGLVLLMADCQTTGGYPRIAQVAAVDMPLCGQLQPGDTLYFNEISWNEAERLYIEQEKHLHQLSATIENKYL
ncbi:MAG: 5-oxoprolinase subunit PxpC [Mucilaginibacter sp.]